MKKCDNCGKETSELCSHTARVPENPDEAIKDPSKIRIKTIEMRICSECLDECEKHQRTLQVKVQREFYEVNDDIKDLK